MHPIGTGRGRFEDGSKSYLATSSFGLKGMVQLLLNLCKEQRAILFKSRFKRKCNCVNLSREKTPLGMRKSQPLWITFLDERTKMLSEPLHKRFLCAPQVEEITLLKGKCLILLETRSRSVYRVPGHNFLISHINININNEQIYSGTTFSGVSLILAVNKKWRIKEGGNK